MASSESLHSAGVNTYNTVKDDPYVRDAAWGFFRGSFGTVYRATRSSTTRFVGKEQVYAIKEIQAVSPKEQLLVAQEIDFLRQFRHPNILEFHEAYIIDSPGHQMLHTIRVVTKPWAPVSLHHFIQDVSNSSGSSTLCSWFKPQELEPWPSIIRQCLNGLDYLHSRQLRPIRHKDIKPHNILLYSEAQDSGKIEVRPIIIDFGISKEHIDGATTANTGTYEYKAPEQIKDQDPTLASDVFSLGCCFALIEGILGPWPGLTDVYDAAMGTGSCQFADNIMHVNQILQDQLTESVDLGGTALGFFSSRFRGLVRQMLGEEPIDRPSAALALETLNTIDSDLARFLDTPTLELCISLQGQARKSLVEVDLSRLRTDGSLIQELDRRYRDASRRHHGLIASFFYEVRDVNYVKLTIRNPDHPSVETEDLSALPFLLGGTFAYQMKLLRNDWNSHDYLYHLSEIYNQIPKKFGQTCSKQLIDTRKPVEGLGLEIIEGYRVRQVFLSTPFLAPMLISVLAVIWEYRYGGDTQLTIAVISVFLQLTALLSYFYLN